VIALLKWLIKKIDKIRHNFLWKGGDHGNNGEICLVKWSMVCKPKDLGGLGIHELNRFGRALRQRWLWYRWMDDSKPWQGMALPCDAQDWALFQASTEIKLGNGKKPSFWQDKWLDGNAPKEIAPNLFKLTHFKNRTVAKELDNNNWIPATYPLEMSF
jgi:hypothetical protein